jgi:hypothetical protein
MEIVILVLSVPLAIVGAVVWGLRRYERNLARSARQNSAEHREAMARAIWAGAKILTAQNEGGAAMMHTGKTHVRLWLEVTPPEGKPYEVAATWRVDLGMLPQFQSGQTVSVKIDRDNPKKIYPNMGGVEDVI